MRTSRRMSEETRPVKRKGAGEDDAFLKLFKVFIQQAELCKQEPRSKEVGGVIEKLLEIKQKPNGAKASELLQNLKGHIEVGAKHLPGHYRNGYSEHLLRNIDAVYEWSYGTIETLSAAVYDHSNEDYSGSVKQLLAFTSNLYRSFLEPQCLPLVNFPKPLSTLPALVTFNPRPDIPSPHNNSFHFVPFTLPVGEVERLCGAQVAVISLPSSYRTHPVLSWGCIAHEAGGHDVLHSYPGLLAELKQGVRELFYHGSDPHQGVPESINQYLALLWQWWTEEAASDVYAVMNLGPVYGMHLAVYFAALNEAIRGPLRGKKRDGLPALPVSNAYIPQNREDIDYHPPNLLALYVVIGAIEALPLPEKSKAEAINKIEAAIHTSFVKGNEVVLKKYDDVNHYQMDQVRIEGWLRLKPGTWIRIEPKDFSIDRLIMQQHARRVGYYIATANLRSFNGYSIQDLETWDENDDRQAETIRDNITQSLPRDAARKLTFAGDDAQMFSGAMLALLNEPAKYAVINKNLATAFEFSFSDDEIWGNPPWHRITDPCG